MFLSLVRLSVGLSLSRSTQEGNTYFNYNSSSNWPSIHTIYRVSSPSANLIYHRYRSTRKRFSGIGSSKPPGDHQPTSDKLLKLHGTTPPRPDRPLSAASRCCRQRRRRRRSISPRDTRTDLCRAIRNCSGNELMAASSSSSCTH